MTALCMHTCGLVWRLCCSSKYSCCCCSTVLALTSASALRSVQHSDPCVLSLQSLLLHTMYAITTFFKNNSPDEVAVCNLASINLSAMVTDGVFDFQRLYAISKVVCKNLNKVIGEYCIILLHTCALSILLFSSVVCYGHCACLTCVAHSTTVHQTCVIYLMQCVVKPVKICCMHVHSLPSLSLLRLKP
jgi:Ribonucleotide reductase, barrel domain